MSTSVSVRILQKKREDGTKKKKSILTTTTAEINHQKIHLPRSGRLRVTFQNSSSFQLLKAASRNFHFLLILADADDKSDMSTNSLLSYRSRSGQRVDLFWKLVKVRDNIFHTIFLFLNTAPCREHVDEVINPSKAMQDK